VSEPSTGVSILKLLGFPHKDNIAACFRIQKKRQQN
jgi:hypothetical protein